MNRMVGRMWMAVLALAVVVGSSMTVGAADQPTGAPRPARGTPARIIFSDHIAKAITMEIRGTIYLFWLNSDLKVSKDGKDARIADLAPGQMVNLTTRRTANGDIEMVAITIHSGAAASEPGVRAGQLNADGIREGRDWTTGQGRGIPPLFAPPAVTRPIVSPYY